MAELTTHQAAQAAGIPHRTLLQYVSYALLEPHRVPGTGGTNFRWTARDVATARFIKRLRDSAVPPERIRGILALIATRGLDLSTDPRWVVVIDDHHQPQGFQTLVDQEEALLCNHTAWSEWPRLTMPLFEPASRGGRADERRPTPAFPDGV